MARFHINQRIQGQAIEKQVKNQDQIECAVYAQPTCERVSHQPLQQTVSMQAQIRTEGNQHGIGVQQVCTLLKRMAHPTRIPDHRGDIVIFSCAWNRRRELAEQREGIDDCDQGQDSAGYQPGFVGFFQVRVGWGQDAGWLVGAVTVWLLICGILLLKVLPKEAFFEPN